MVHEFMIVYANDKTGKMHYSHYVAAEGTSLLTAWSKAAAAAMTMINNDNDWYVQSIVYTAR